MWVGPQGSTAIPGDAVAATGRSVELPAAELQEAEAVFVLDDQKRAVAVMPAREALQRGTWNVGEEDFTLLEELTVEVTHAGLPVAAGVVELTVGEEVRRNLLSPDDQGVARFSLVPAGEVKIQVEYETEGQMRKTALQTFTLSISDPETHAVRVVVTDPVETVGAVDPAEAQEPSVAGVTPTEEPAPRPRQGILQTLIGMLVSLALLSAIVYGIVLLIRKNPQALKDALDKAGVVTGASQATNDPPTQAVKVPEPIRPILLGDAPVAPVPTAAAAVQNPRLVREDGAVILLPEGETVVGREPGRHFESESTVSRRHAVLVCSGGQVLVRDENSSNGTYVNGIRISGDTPLQPGDLVQFGAAKLKFEA